MKTRLRPLALLASLGLSALALVSCKAADEPGYMIQVDVMLSEEFDTLTTVDIFKDGADLGSKVEDAKVTIQLNDGSAVDVPYRSSDYTLFDNINGLVPKAGDTMTVTITIGSTQLRETVSVPAVVKVKPIAAAQDASKPIDVTWDAASTASDEFQIAIVDKYTAADNPMGYFKNIAGSSTSYTIPAGTLKRDTKGVYVQITALNTHQLTGPDYEPSSWFTISNATGVTFDTL